MCYTYDELSRVTKRTLVNLSDNTETVEEYTYDAAGNITSSEADIDVTFSYDTNNRLASADGVAVTYDLDGNMTFASVDGTSYSGTFDSHNRLVSMRGHTYTYDVQSVRIRDLTDEYETTFVYDTNSKLSKLLVKTTGDVTTKYVYGRGLIGEESSNTFKTYHYDYRGSTIAITDSTGAVTDTFAYDTYGKRIARTGSTDTPFQYDGRDGVVTDETGLLYMRARYYCPDLRRFINADIIAGDITNAITLNRYAYANGNPVSNIDPFGLSAERGTENDSSTELSPIIQLNLQKFLDDYFLGKTTVEALLNEDILKAFYEYMRNGVLNEPRPNNIGKGTWAKRVEAELKWVDDVLGPNSRIAKAVEKLGTVSVIIDVVAGVYKNVESGTDTQRIVTDAVVDACVSVGGGWFAGTSATIAVAKIGAVAGTTIAPGVGSLIGAGVATLAGIVFYFVTEVVEIDGKSIVDHLKDDVDTLVDNAGDIAIINVTAASLGGGGGGGGSCGVSTVMFGMKEYEHLFMP